MARNRINESTIQNYLGGSSFVSGLICFFSGSTYDKLFGKWGFVGLLVYLGISLIIFCLIWGFKRIRVPERFQSVVQTILFVAICCISVGLDKLVPGKSDALSILSYGLFVLMSVSKSRRSELGFETGFFSFFLSLFLEQLVETKLELLRIGLVFGLAAFFFRLRSQSGSPNGDRPQEAVPLINAPAPAIDNHESLDLEGQDPPEMGEVSGESLSSTNNEQHNQVESSEATHHSPSNYGQVSEAIIEETRSSFSATHHSPRISEGSTTDGDNEQNNEQEEDSSPSLPAGYSYSWEQDQVSSRNNQNGWMHTSSPPRQLLRRRSRGLTRGIQVMSSRVGDTLEWWRHHVAPASFFFFFKNP